MPCSSYNLQQQTKILTTEQLAVRDKLVQSNKEAANRLLLTMLAELNANQTITTTEGQHYYD